MGRSLSPDIEELLQDLRPQCPVPVKKKAVEELGKLSTSDLRIVKALIAVKESDPSYEIRKLAAYSLRAAVHRKVLDQYPALLESAISEVRLSTPPKLQGVTLKETYPPGEKDVMAQQSSGSKLGAICGLVVTLAFFLPWTRACGAELSGYDIAADSTGLVQDAWLHWATILAGLFCIALFFLVRTNSARTRIQAAVARLIAAFVGFFPMLKIWYYAKQEGIAIELLYGGWLTILGYLGILVSSFTDLKESADSDDY
jgi:hypothetical protein